MNKLKCLFCGKEINESDHDSYEWVDLGDAIHKTCRRGHDKELEKIGTMSCDDFESWISGYIHWHHYCILEEIKQNDLTIYVRRKGMKVPYTYKKYDTKYLQFSHAQGAFYIKIKDICIYFPINKYKKTWAFNKEDFDN